MSERKVSKTFPVTNTYPTSRLNNRFTSVQSLALILRQLLLMFCRPYSILRGLVSPHVPGGWTLRVLGHGQMSTDARLRSGTENVIEKTDLKF